MSSEPSDSSSVILRDALTRTERLAVIVAGVAIPALFGAAMYLTPDVRGYGTHQQLGLPSCTFLRVTGVLCPQCGLTTSFCWFVRGEWSRAIEVNPAGFLLAVILIVLWPCLILTLKTGFWRGVRSPGLTVVYGAAAWLLLSVLLWLVRMWK